MKYCDKIVKCELTTDDMLEMAEKEVDSTTEEVATPIKKPRVGRKKKDLSAQAKIKLAKDRAKEVLDISGNKPSCLHGCALGNFVYIYNRFR